MLRKTLILFAFAALSWGCSSTSGEPGNEAGAPSGSGGSSQPGPDGSGGSEGPGPGPSPGVPGSTDMGDKTALELLQDIKIGWNLGNSLDVPEGETAWSNPLVTPQILQKVADSGFQIVRIPVTWSKFIGPAPEFKIDAERLQRVQEVVDYAMEAGLYAVINLHHDGAENYDGVEWIRLRDAAGQVTEENNRQVREKFVAVWQQIAAHFEQYGERLLFESMNEIHVGYGEPEPAWLTIINELNQTFVDTIRAGAGHNPKRYLVVPGYNTNVSHTLKGFQKPNDTASNRLILSVHFYDPYTFALEAEKNVWGEKSQGNKDDWGQESNVIEQFDLLKSTYIDQGLPVVLGEYGATHQAGFEEYRRYYMEYVTKAAVDRGIVPIYWDNGGTSSGKENLGLFHRATAEVAFPAVLEAMIRASSSDYSIEEIQLPLSGQ